MSLTGPLGPQTLAEGDDFFTNVLGLPADGSQRRMMGWEENYTNVGVGGGVWSGTFSANGAYAFPLFSGFAGALFADSLQDDPTLPKLGINYRIDSSKYRRLAYRQNQTLRSARAVYWESSETKPNGYWPDPESPRCASFDGFYSDQGYNYSGYVVYDLDLSNLAGNCEQSLGSWSGNVHALRIDPSLAGAAGAVTQFDWIRLVDPSSAPNITVTWNASGLNGTHITKIMVDDNNSGFDGSPVKIYNSGASPGSYTFPSAILPPGTFYFYVEIQTASGGNLGSVVRSGYSAPVTIRAKPHIAVTAPAPDSGDDYATTVRGNAWDMDLGGTDLMNVDAGMPQILRQFITPSFELNPNSVDGGAVFQAQAEPPYFSIGNVESDVQLWMRIPTSTPIDPSHFRYVTYRMAIGEYGYPTISDKVRQGWVSRIVAWNSDLINDGLRTKPQIVYEGWNTYWFDIGDSNTVEYGFPWLSFFRIPNFRLDPGEFTIAGFYTWFFLDFFKLSGENRAPNGQYNVRFNLSDADSSSFDVGIYYDSNNSGFDGTLITQLNGLGAGAHQYTWNTTALPENTPYWIYLVVSDGVNTSRRYSTVHVRTGAYSPSLPEPRSRIVEFDYDGDGQSDHAVYRIASRTTGRRRRRRTTYSGTYYYNKSAQGYSTEAWGDQARYRPIYGDFDGDNKTDQGLTVNAGNQLWHYVRHSGTNTVYARAWGLVGDQLVIADYDGNGTDDFGVYRGGQWYIIYFDGRVEIKYWGYPTDVPVPADYDGDLKADIAIWRPEDGTWWILNSAPTSEWLSTLQWGLTGDIPVPADWNTDGKNDYMVFRPSTGTWFLRERDSDATSFTQWGLPGDMPRIGDYNGDGLLDLTVYRNGLWFHNFRNGQVGVVGFGLPGDFVPVKSGSLW